LVVTWAFKLFDHNHSAGQAAATSLSKAGGVAPDTQLTPEALANMSDADFSRLFNELQESGNRDELLVREYQDFLWHNSQSNRSP
jgi:hypothetical protein